MADVRWRPTVNAGPSLRRTAVARPPGGFAGHGASLTRPRPTRSYVSLGERAAAQSAAEILAAAITLRALHGLSDFETVQELRCGPWRKAACGVHQSQDGAHPDRLPAPPPSSGRPPPGCHQSQLASRLWPLVAQSECAVPWLVGHGTRKLHCPVTITNDTWPHTRAAALNLRGLQPRSHPHRGRPAVHPDPHVTEGAARPDRRIGPPRDLHRPSRGGRHSDAQGDMHPFGSAAPEREGEILFLSLQITPGYGLLDRQHA